MFFNGDCEFGRIEKYEQQGASVERTELGVIVNDRVCNRSVDKNGELAQTKTKDEIIDFVLESGRVGIKVVIPILKLTKEDFEGVKKSVESIKSQNYPNCEIKILTFIKRKNFDYKLFLYLNEEIGIRSVKVTKFSVWELLDKETFEDNSRNSSVVVVCEPGQELPKDYLERINFLENEEMVNLFYADPIKGYDWHGLVYDMNVREYTERDYGGTTREKIIKEGHSVQNILEY